MKNKIILKLKVILVIFIFYNCSLYDKNLKPLIDEYKLKSYIENFNNDDEELYSNISNKDALNFLQKNIPLFECPSMLNIEKNRVKLFLKKRIC